MSFNGEYQLTLSIPATTCHLFTLRPLAWLRYVAFTIYGSEGHISSEQGGNEVDYTTAELSDRYYYVSQGRYRNSIVTHDLLVVFHIRLFIARPRYNGRPNFGQIRYHHRAGQFQN